MHMTCILTCTTAFAGYYTHMEHKVISILPSLQRLVAGLEEEIHTMKKFMRRIIAVEDLPKLKTNPLSSLCLPHEQNCHRTLFLLNSCCL